MNNIYIILLAILTSFASSGSIIWIFKTWISERLKQSIQHEYDQKIEAFKSSLKAQADLEAEKLRSQLQIEASKRNIEYSRIHEKRLEIISELAMKLDSLATSVAIYVSYFGERSGPDREEKRKIANKIFLELHEYFAPRRMFLTKSIVSKIDRFRSDLTNISMEFSIFVEMPAQHDSDRKKEFETWHKANDYIQKEAPKLIGELEDNFRALLGMDDGAA